MLASRGASLLCKRLLLLSTAKNSRCLYTQEFLGVTFFLQKQQMMLKELREKQIPVPSLRQRVERLVGPQADQQSTEVAVDCETETTTVLSDDIRRYIYTSNSPEDAYSAADILRAYVTESTSWDSPAIMTRKRHLFKDLACLCHDKQYPQAVKLLMKDEEFLTKVGFIDVDTGSLGQNIPTIVTMYLDLLYELKQYQEVLDEVELLQQKVDDTPLFFTVLAMMSCLRLNTAESLESASTFVNERNLTVSRVAHPYALLASNQGNHLLAYETVSLVPRTSVIRTGLLVYLLVKLNRLPEAMDLLDGVIREAESEDGPLSNKSNIIFSIETVTHLTKAVEACGDKALQVRLATLYGRLDKVASIGPNSLLETVAGPIDVTKGLQYKRQKNRIAYERRKTLLADDGQEDTSIDSHDHQQVLRD